MGSPCRAVWTSRRAGTSPFTKLIASLGEDVEIQQAWIIVVERRLEAYRNGEIDAVTVEDALQEARRRIQEPSLSVSSRPRDLPLSSLSASL